MENYEFHKGRGFHWFTFNVAFDFEKEICKLSITNPMDIHILANKFRECLELQDSKEESPSWESPSFHEGASFTCYNCMKEAFELFKQGAMKAPFAMRRTAGTAIHINNKSYKSAINAKIYNLDEYNERIKQYNLKRGLMLSDLDFDGDLSASDVETLCEGLKTYESKDIFSPHFLNNFLSKLRMEYNGKVEVEDSNA